MQYSPVEDFQAWADERRIAARYAPIHDMVTARLAKTDPGGYVGIAEVIRNKFKPVGGEVRIADFMAHVAWRIRGCQNLDPEILDEREGPNRFETLGRYQRRLSREFSRCTRILEMGAKNRQFAEARMAESLLRRKPCTSVIQ
jgi:hypothetical protein